MYAQIISFNCILKSKTGQLISQTYNRNVINVVDGPVQMLNGLARGLQKLKTGEKRKITLYAEEAYGLYEPKKVILYPKVKLQRNIKIGEMVSIQTKSGKILTYQVVKIHDDFVSLDGNHPLAGQDLIFEIEALEARDATDAEIADCTNFISSQVLH